MSQETFSLIILLENKSCLRFLPFSSASTTHRRLIHQKCQWFPRNLHTHTLGFYSSEQQVGLFSSHQCFFLEGGVEGKVGCLHVLVFGFVPSYCDLIFRKNISSSMGSVLDTLLDFKRHHFFPPFNCQFQNTL